MIITDSMLKSSLQDCGYKLCPYEMYKIGVSQAQRASEILQTNTNSPMAGPIISKKLKMLVTQVSLHFWIVCGI